MANREQAEEKQRRQPEAGTGHVVSRLDVEEVRTRRFLPRVGLPLSSDPIGQR